MFHQLFGRKNLCDLSTCYIRLISMIVFENFGTLKIRLIINFFGRIKKKKKINYYAYLIISSVVDCLRKPRAISISSVVLCLLIAGACVGGG